MDVSNSFIALSAAYLDELSKHVSREKVIPGERSVWRRFKSLEEHGFPEAIASVGRRRRQ